MNATVCVYVRVCVRVCACVPACVCVRACACRVSIVAVCVKVLIHNIRLCAY